MSDLYQDPIGTAELAAKKLTELTGKSEHHVALVMGSGWISAADALGTPTHEFPAVDLPGFLAPTVAGHGGVIRSYNLQGPSGTIHALVFLGRTHLYEGKGIEPVVHGVRTAVKAGCKVVVLTNACGGLMPHWQPGTPVLISDHINFTGQTPLVGAKFVDLTSVYSPRLRELCKQIDPSLEEGIYVGFAGPQYETPAEIEMVRRWGAHLVGMSTVLEAIAAREAGLEVLGVSLVTNLAAGMSGEPLDHAEVLAAGKAAAQRMGTLLAQVLRAV